MTVGGCIEGRSNWFLRKAFLPALLRKPHKHLSINQGNCHLRKGHTAETVPPIAWSWLSYFWVHTSSSIITSNENAFQCIQLSETELFPCSLKNYSCLFYKCPKSEILKFPTEVKRSLNIALCKMLLNTHSPQRSIKYVERAIGEWRWGGFPLLAPPRTPDQF